ncbi:MAG: hypothetical protein ACRCXM_04285 [Beijerinckiaceae bacterium]
MIAHLWTILSARLARWLTAQPSVAGSLRIFIGALAVAAILTSAPLWIR